MFCITENVRSDLIKNEKMENGKQNDFSFVFFVLLFDIYYFFLIFGGIKEVFFLLVFISVVVYGRNNGKNGEIIYCFPYARLSDWEANQPARLKAHKAVCGIIFILFISIFSFYFFIKSLNINRFRRLLLFTIEILWISDSFAWNQ